MRGGDTTGHYHFNIPAGDATETLRVAAQLADTQLLFANSVTNGKRTRAITGWHTIQTTLDRLLSGTQLVVVPVSGGNGFGVVNAPCPAA